MVLNTKNRVERLRSVLVEKELDGIFISQPENRCYLSGFNGSAGYLLITAKDTRLATDFRYLEQVKIQSPDFSLVRISGKVAEWFIELIDVPGLKRLGFESGDITHAMYRILTDAISKAGSEVQMIPVDGIVEGLRAIKEPEEIELIKQAVTITDNAFAYIDETIREGMTEIEVAWELEKYQREHGSQAMPFDIIVASGPNSARPHAQPSDRKIEKGDPIVIDMGAKFGGYCSDFTRTLCIGEQDETFKKVYDTVLGAQLTAISLIKAGMTGKEADGFARTVIQEAGYGEEFGHSLGHGTGMVVHEQPTVGPNSEAVLENGMVFSVEPGIYLPGWGGVRIEDLAVLENGVINVLSKGAK
ncbi:MAG: aminopeptidase P family protein [Dehalococcoidales bacterium]|nr:aminopeptidase P family protein [Dehalococcoidales bacterium]